MHPALDLLHRGPVQSRMQMPYSHAEVYWVLMLGILQEPGVAYAVPHYDKGPARELPARCRPACHRPARNNHARPIVNMFVPTGDISVRGRVWGQGWEKRRKGRCKRPQGTKEGRGGKRRRRKEERGRNRAAAQMGRDRE